MADDGRRYEAACHAMQSAFIAAANPQTVLSLLDALSETQAALTAEREARQRVEATLRHAETGVDPKGVYDGWVPICDIAAALAPVTGDEA